MDSIETVGLGIHWEDLPVGRKFKTVGRTVTEADLVNFITCTGMLEVLFTNTEFIEKESAIKGRVVPGALAYTFAEGLLIQSVMQGVGLAFLNMELDIKAPTFVGDTIHVECEVIECQRQEATGPGTGAHSQSSGEAGRHGGVGVYPLADGQGQANGSLRSERGHRRMSIAPFPILPCG